MFSKSLFKTIYSLPVEAFSGLNQNINLSPHLPSPHVFVPDNKNKSAAWCIRKGTRLSHSFQIPILRSLPPC